MKNFMLFLALSTIAATTAGCERCAGYTVEAYVHIELIDGYGEAIEGADVLVNGHVCLETGKAPTYECGSVRDAEELTLTVSADGFRFLEQPVYMERQEDELCPYRMMEEPLQVVMIFSSEDA